MSEISKLLTLRGALSGEVSEEKSLGSRVDAYLEHVYVEENNRKQGVFSPSEISVNFCPRAWCLGLMHPEEKRKNIGASLRKVFDLGTAVHDIMQRYLGDMGILYGEYVCVLCGKRVNNDYVTKKPKACECGCRNLRYEEVEVRDDSRNIYGHTDGQLLIDNKFKYVWELKSARKELFSSLGQPLDKHKRQAMIYLFCLDKYRKERIEELENRVTENENDRKLLEEELAFQRKEFEGVIIQYYCKNDSTTKEFVLKFTQEELEEYINSLEPAMSECAKFCIDRVLPCRTCKNKTEATKVRCKMKSLCFDTYK